MRHEVPKTAGTMPHGTFYDPAMVSHLLGSHAMPPVRPLPMIEGDGLPVMRGYCPLLR